MFDSGSDPGRIQSALLQIKEALATLEWRIIGIDTPNDFISSMENKTRLDAIAMVLIAIGENFKKIDKLTEFSG